MKPVLLYFKDLTDNRGGLVSLEQNKNIPFTIKRVYYLFGTEKDVRRGMHAHKALEQVAICVKGACTFLLDDGHSQSTTRLDSPKIGLYIGHALWREMYDFTDDCVLMVLASEYYDESDYIRGYDDFIEQVGSCATC